MPARHTVPRLPTELWTSVLGLLPRHDLKICLFLSRAHHDIAFSILFSHITITFGPWLWRESESAVQSSRRRIWSNDEPDCERMVRRNNHTWDLLGAIPRRSDLAKVVKEVTVRAYTWEDREYVSEMGCLIDALEVLPNVCAFRWYGERPAPPPEVFEALARRSSTTLIELGIPVLEHMASVLEPVHRFLSLRFLSLVFPEDTEVNTHDDAIIRLINTRAPTITRLSVSGEILWTCQSLSSSRALQGLELIYTNTFNGLGEILVHCAAITSLTMLPTECADLGQLFATLEEHPDTLPDLTSFKYLAPSEDSCMVTAERVVSLCKFLKNKRYLRRLDVKFDGIDRVERPLLELLPELPALAVLGFSFVRGARWMPEDILPFERAIPAHVSALRLEHLLDRGMGVVDDRLDPYTACRGAWLKLFKSRTSLRYLHIVEFPTRATDTERDSGNRGLTFHRLTAEDLPSSLELFGNRADIHPIIRAASAPNGASASRSKFGPCWSLEKIAFRTVEDFGCADWEWLFRWHDFNSLDFFRTGVLQHGVYGQWAMSG